MYDDAKRAGMRGARLSCSLVFAKTVRQRMDDRRCWLKALTRLEYEFKYKI